MHAKPKVKCLHTDSVGVTWLWRIAPAASLPSSATQCSLARDRFLMMGCKHDEMFCQHCLCHHHLHIFMLAGGVRGQTPNGIELKKPATASHEMFTRILVCVLGIFQLWVVTLCQNQFRPTASQKSDHLVHTGTNMWAVSLFWFRTRHKPCTV